MHINFKLAVPLFTCNHINNFISVRHNLLLYFKHYMFRF